MLPVYLKIFDEKLLFPQGATDGSQSIPLYTVFTGQAILYFCLIEGDDRVSSWFRIVHASGRNEDELFSELVVACRSSAINVALAPGAGTIQQVKDIGAEFARMYREGDYSGILGVDRGCKDPDVFEKACETQKLVFSEEKEIQAICDNAEHRLTTKYRPPPPPVQQPLKKPQGPGQDVPDKTAASTIARLVAYAIAIVIILFAALCLFIMIYLYWAGGRPFIEIVR